MTNQCKFQVRAFALDLESIKENPTWAHKADTHTLPADNEVAAERIATTLLGWVVKDGKTVYYTQVWTVGDNPTMLHEFEA